MTFYYPSRVDDANPFVECTTSGCWRPAFTHPTPSPCAVHWDRLSMKPWRPSGTHLYGGKYAGLSYEHVAGFDPGYLDFLLTSDKASFEVMTGIKRALLQTRFGMSHDEVADFSDVYVHTVYNNHMRAVRGEL